MANYQIFLLYHHPHLLTNELLFDQLEAFAELRFDTTFQKSIQSKKKQLNQFKNIDSNTLQAPAYLELIHALSNALDEAYARSEKFQTQTIRDAYSIFERIQAQGAKASAVRVFYDQAGSRIYCRLHRENGNLIDQRLNKNIPERIQLFQTQLTRLKRKQIMAQNKSINGVHLKKLETAISLVKKYHRQLVQESKSWFSFFNIFHWSRQSAKLKYCVDLLEAMSQAKQSAEASITDQVMNLHHLIHAAHQTAISQSKNPSAVTAGGSYFGTSRLLTMQRLLNLESAWHSCGKSRLGFFATSSDFHGLKTTGLVVSSENQDKKITVEQFFSNPKIDVSESYNDLIQTTLRGFEKTTYVFSNPLRL